MGRKNSTTSSQAQLSCPCVLCKKTVNKDDQAIQCDYCQPWVHATCANISDAYYDSLEDSAQLCFCPICLPTAKNFLQLNKRFNDLEN
uniref:PHD-type domain-containing protein n=1 Tax=Romanomermis culicivorax TaxID=13658 RepID=A0A915IYU8_ROMCU